VAWLSSSTGKTYRLLSEAEREYVTRAGSSTPFWWGSSVSTAQANYNGEYTYAGGSTGEYRKATVPVDSFAANAGGLFNVHGNGGLLERKECRQPGRWNCKGQRRLQSSRSARRFLGQRSEGPPFSQPRLGPTRSPRQQCRPPCCQNAFTSLIFINASSAPVWSLPEGGPHSSCTGDLLEYPCARDCAQC
jgi:hypothetical protein